MKTSKIDESLLLDFYASLLTTKQVKVLNAYLNEDLSMQEIAEDLAVSKSAINDLIKRSINQMHKLEENLSLVAKFKKRNALYDKLEKIKEPMISDIIKEFKKIESED